jgi:hypothetical protein
MIEIVPNSIAAPPQSANIAAPPTRDLGERILIGEIVDTKCFLGVMNPGEGKVPRECAALCLSGGIPRALLPTIWMALQR